MGQSSGFGCDVRYGYVGKYIGSGYQPKFRINHGNASGVSDIRDDYRSERMNLTDILGRVFGGDPGAMQAEGISPTPQPVPEPTSIPITQLLFKITSVTNPNYTVTVDGIQTKMTHTSPFEAAEDAADQFLSNPTADVRIKQIAEWKVDKK